MQPNHGRLQTKIVSSKEKASPLSHCVSTTLFLSIVKSYYPSLTSHSLLTESLPESWMMAASDPLTVVKLRVVPQVPHPRVDTLITVAVHDHLTWTLSVLHKRLDPAVNPSLSHQPLTLTSARSVRALLQVIDSLVLCVGNPDQKFQDLWKHRSVTLHGSSGCHIYMCGHALDPAVYPCYCCATINNIIDLRFTSYACLYPCAHDPD